METLKEISSSYSLKEIFKLIFDDFSAPDKKKSDYYEEKIKSTSFHNQAEDFIAGKVTILELRLKHLKDRTGIELVSAEYLSKLRQIPCDDFSDSSIPKKISNLRFDVLEHIETNYSRWFPTEKI